MMSLIVQKQLSSKKVVSCAYFIAAVMSGVIVGEDVRTKMKWASNGTYDHVIIALVERSALHGF